jgi:NADPH:quinone reductase-like Zn-dependent oxidoreductase
MTEALNRVVQLGEYGGPEFLRIVDLPTPVAGPGEVRVRTLASSVNYTETLIRRHLYPQTAAYKVPFVMGYDIVGEIDQVGPGVTNFAVGDRVADMTVVGSDATYRTLKAKNATRVPPDVDAAEAATLILSWTTAYQLLHRVAKVRKGQRILVHGAGGAVGQALLSLAKLAGIETWGAAHARHAGLIRELGANPIDYDRVDFTRVLPGGFDVVIDGIGEGGYRRSLAAVKRGGLLIAIGYSAGAQAGQGMPALLATIARLYLWGWMTGGKRTRFYSINAMRARHPDWFKQDLALLLQLLRDGRIRPHVAGRISFEQVIDAHHRLEAGGLEGKLVLCPAQLGPSVRKIRDDLRNLKLK